MTTDRLKFDPAKNPGTLDTLTWEPAAALKLVQENSGELAVLGEALATNTLPATAGRIKLFPSSFALKDGLAYTLALLPDGQKVILCASTSAKPSIETLGEVGARWGTLYVIPASLDCIAEYVTKVAPQFGPKAAGTVGRLGIGNRQTVTVWPGIFAGITEVGGPAEAIQNSAYRELAPMEFILAPPSSEAAYLPGHGSLSIGHTGTSIEGLWLNGVVCAIEHGFIEPYGADLDHIPVKGLDEPSMSHAKRLIELGKHYTFFTLDTSFLFKLDAADFSMRYGDSINAAVELYYYIKSLKGDTPFDFEFSLDEGPAITTPEEQEFVLNEITKRGVNVTFIAPNVGFEKRKDYVLPDGLPALEARVRELCAVAKRYGALLDFHSGSDKASATYRIISKACGGKLKLKVAGKLQLILAEVLADLDPDFFNFWWDWTLETARGEAARGSRVGAEYTSIIEERIASDGDSFRRSPKDLFFTDFSFSMVGAKDESGKFLFRDRFYSLSPTVQDEYTRRVKDYVVDLAGDLGLRRR